MQAAVSEGTYAFKWALNRPNIQIHTDRFVIENGILKEYKGAGANVDIPFGVTEIGDFAFSDCAELTGAVIPDSVIRIGEGAFSGCERLTGI